MQKSIVWATAVAAGLSTFSADSTHAGSASWGLSGNGSWAVDGNWNPAVKPNGIGDVATFTGATSNPRTITVDSGPTGYTIGGFTTSVSSGGSIINPGTAGSKLILNNGGSGVLLKADGTQNAPTSIVAPMTLNDNVTAQIDNVEFSNLSGSTTALNLRGAMDGSGGFTKTGDGAAYLEIGAKTYTGPTAVNAGRLQISAVAQPSATSSLIVNSGSQLMPTTTGTYTFGPNAINLNGTGAGGPYANRPGAIRNSGGREVVIANNVNLQSSSQVVAEQAIINSVLGGSLTFTGVISGGPTAQLTAGSTNITSGGGGDITFTNANTFTGGLLVSQGNIILSGPNATAGGGDVTVNGPNASRAVLAIESGVLNGIADNATVSLQGGVNFGLADVNYASLAAGVNETVGTLYLGGYLASQGTWGSLTSNAQFKSNEYFTGDGIFTVVTPEPGALSLLAAGGIFVSRRRRAFFTR